MAFHLRWRRRVRGQWVHMGPKLLKFAEPRDFLLIFWSLWLGCVAGHFAGSRFGCQRCESIVVSQHPMCPGEWWKHRSKGAIRSPSDFTDFTDQSKWLPACLAKVVCFTQRCIWCIQWIQGFNVYSTYVAVRGRWCIKPVMLQSFMMKLPLAALNLVGTALQEQMEQVDNKAVTGDSRSKLHDFGRCFTPNSRK